ncbi:hypothetical protein SHKM778_95490 (plasmid) [Streptomyces sp. KM77-8]|uniref:Uncharacterized protein n=1 Tax=Streptomyces haneummycinicus TaxID=3074435 RepID=A0AAT9I0E8_9ACTN
MGEATVEGLLAGIPDDAEAFQGLGACWVEGAGGVQVALPGQPAAQWVVSGVLIVLGDVQVVVGVVVSAGRGQAAAPFGALGGQDP